MGVVAPVLIILFVFGAVIGSFLNVVIHRLPRAEGWRAQLGSLVSPGSHCPGCERPIAWYDNIPLVSYALLRGRCRRCGESIPIRYPLVEFANASLYLLAGLVLGLGPELYPALLFISTLIAVFFIDLEHYIIPNVIVLPVAAVGLVSMIAIEPGRWLELLLAGVISAAFFLLIAFVREAGGDDGLLPGHLHTGGTVHRLPHRGAGGPGPDGHGQEGAQEPRTLRPFPGFGRDHCPACG
jgi:leader peptidase (prepilin peptidase)/N-methyltransferase